MSRTPATRKRPRSHSRKRKVLLVPLSEPELAAVLRQHVAEYAEAKTLAGQWQPEEALTRSREEISRLLQDRPRERGHRFLKAMDETGRRVGWLWVGPLPGKEDEVGTRWLYQIRVEDSLRGQGYGRAMLDALEASLRDEGRTELRLNVFAYNRAARALYESCGYVVAFKGWVGTEMRKPLGP